MAMLLFVIGFIILVLLCNNAACTPQITNATNSQTGTHLYLYPNYGDTVIFTAEANETITTWTWHANEYDQFNNHPTYSLLYTDFGYHNVSVYGTNAGGNTNTIIWIVWVNRELRDTHAENVDETAYNMLQDSISDEPSFHALMRAISHPYTSALGLIFYLFLFGLPLLMMYIRQDSMTIPATLMFIIGGVIIAMLPAQWQIITGALMGLALFGMLYKLYKERG
jgi:uncharacterized membrane protein (DUF485 family)